MTERRSKGDDSVYFEHADTCRDATRHRRCLGRWRGEVTLGYGPDGKRLRRRVAGATKAEVQEALKELRAHLAAGIAKSPPANYTVRKAAEDWLRNGLPGRAPKTIRKNKDVLEPILAVIGTTKLTDLSAADVDNALARMATEYSTAAVRMGHLALKRAVKFAAARDLVARNVADLSETPAGQKGRPSRSFTLAQSAALIKASSGTRIGAYIALCLGTGIRTEEARALRWEAVDFGDPQADPPRPASVAVWRSVRHGGDIKTLRSRRTLRLPLFAAESLKLLREREGNDSELVFATRDGRELDAANVRREFRAAVRAAGIPGS